MTITNPLGGLRSRSGEHIPGPLLVLTGALAAVVAASALWGTTCRRMRWRRR